MGKIRFMFFVVAICIGVTNVLAQQQVTVRMRGTISNFDGHVLQIYSREGNVLKVNVSDDTKINVLAALNLSHLKPGTFVGVTAIQTGPGTPLQAREVHIFPESMRGTGEGHYDWDLEPGSSMTNANVDAIVSTNNGEELTLSYKGGNQKIVVSQDVPIITFNSADRSLLRVGAQIFVISQQNPDGQYIALRILLGTDGMKPPM